jgi:hypothetical protein
MLLRPELSKNALTCDIFKSSLIATNSATDYYEYIIKLTFSVHLTCIKYLLESAHYNDTDNIQNDLEKD